MTGFISLLTGKLHTKIETKLNNFPAGYVGRFYRDLAINVDSTGSSDFYGRIANDADIPSDDIQKYLLGTTDFAKVMQNDINHKKNLTLHLKIFSEDKTPLSLFFKDVSTFDMQNPIV